MCWKTGDVEEVATSQEPQNGDVPPQPQLEQANQSLVAQSGAPEYAPHVINTPLAFLIKSALNTNIFGEPGWMGTGWRAGRDLQRHDIGGKNRYHQQLKRRVVLRLRSRRRDVGVDWLR